MTVTLTENDIEFRQQNLGDNVWTLRVDTKSEKKTDAINLRKQILKNQEKLTEFYKAFPRKLSDITPMEVIKTLEFNHTQLYALYIQKHEIVERVKKQRDKVNRLSWDGADISPDIFQKILGDKK